MYTIMKTNYISYQYCNNSTAQPYSEFMLAKNILPVTKYKFSEQ